MQNNEDILLKIKKLIAMSEGAERVGNIEEAHTFAAKATDLLTRYSLSRSDLSTSECESVGETWLRMDDYGVLTRHRLQYWQKQLAAIVADYTYCESLSTLSDCTIVFIGTESNREIAARLYVILIRSIYNEAESRHKREYSRLRKLNPEFTRSLRGYKKSFAIGAVAALQERFRKLRSKTDVETGGAVTALVKVAGLEVQAYIDSMDLVEVEERTEALEVQAHATLAGMQYAEGLQIFDGLGASDDDKLISR